MSALLSRTASTPAPLPFDLLAFSLEPSDRAVLHQRIARRFDVMLAHGLIDEVKALRRRYPRLPPDQPSMRCVGYRQVRAFLDGTPNNATRDHDALRDQGIAATRQMAKRQLTWLRSMEDLTSIDCLRTDLETSIIASTQSFLERKSA